MRKIRGNFNQKDRVVCVTDLGCHEFYYQPAGSKERMLLFTTDEFSGSIFAYFRDKSRNMNGRGFSLTVRELYSVDIATAALTYSKVERCTLEKAKELIKEFAERKVK